MRFREFMTERHQQRTGIAYHGTSSAFLKGILRDGLLVDPPQKSWGSKIPGEASIHGVYLVLDKEKARRPARVAANLHGGDPIIVTVQYSERSGGPDEDLFFDEFIRLAVTSKDSLRDYYKPHKIIRSKWSKQMFLKDTVGPAVELLKSVSLPTNATIEYTKQFFEYLYKFISQDWVRPRDFMEHTKLIGIVRNIMKTAKEQTNPFYNGFQIGRNIKFRGKTKILKIEDYDGNTLYPQSQAKSKKQSVDSNTYHAGSMK